MLYSVAFFYHTRELRIFHVVTRRYVRREGEREKESQLCKRVYNEPVRDSGTLPCTLKIDAKYAYISMINQFECYDDHECDKE